MSREDDNTRPTLKTLEGMQSWMKTMSIVGVVLGAGFAACIWLYAQFGTAEASAQHETRIQRLERESAVTAVEVNSRLMRLDEQVKEIAKTVGARVMP